MSFKKDYFFGLNCESQVLPVIQKFFNRNITKSTKFEKFDFFDEKYKYELKSRNCNYNTFETTIIPCNKVCKRVYFLFNFRDGLYYIKFRRAIFDTFEKKEFVRHKRADYNDKELFYYYIPIKYLKKIPYNIS